MSVLRRSPSTLRLSLLVVAACVLSFLGGCSSAKKPPAKATAPAAATLTPVYVHMNGKNMFLESVVAVFPHQPVVFVNEDTGMHMVLGYDPLTGKVNPTFSGALPGTPGPGHPVSTYRISFDKPGIYYYYCPVHAELEKAPGGVYVPVKRPMVHGFPVPMAGLVIVTDEKALVAEDPPTSHEKILPGYFGG
jgi:plastocyanin